MQTAPQSKRSRARALIENTLRYSRYARGVIDSQPALLKLLVQGLEQPWSKLDIEQLLCEVRIRDIDGLKRALRAARRHVMLRLMARDLAGLAQLREVVETTTWLAELSIDHALTQIEKKLRVQYGKPLGADSGKPQKLIVVGMGKLGGADLNVSSDIDLIFAYAEEGQTGGPQCISNQEYFTLLGQSLIAALSENTPEGFVFRVDMRLRPYGDVGALAASFQMLEDYYQSQGREWERYAWIKARVVSGDGKSELMRLMRPFVFRKYLDFGAFDSLREMHRQIRREVARRDLHDNIKLGPGGIREIEFIAQIFQLIRGGHEPALQLRSTLQTLVLLGKQNLLPGKTVKALCEAYHFLRRLEHRLQYLDDAQTHSLPDNPDDSLAVARSMGFANSTDFTKALGAHRRRVTLCFNEVFSDRSAGDKTHDLTPLWNDRPDEKQAVAKLKKLGYRDCDESWARLQRFRNSERIRLLPENSHVRLDGIVPLLLENACKFDNADATLARMLELIEKIVGRAAYVALLSEHPQALAQLARL
ncbi:MAG: bifunctional [glutamate--ammonia ligase]-adenylyl-L-tyrosine phosphorylase/[glutamate--ammonia-ligase] adenylyltransferase, partial [Burkholderiales bacterium]